MAHKTLVICMVLCFLITPTVIAQVPTPDPVMIPDPVPLIDTDGNDLLNILLLGSDTSNPQNSGRTDVIMVVSINRTHNSIAMLSVPRDLYIYIPGWQMGRINTAYGYGEDVESGGGARLLMETLRYHLGLEIDYYARVDFDGFKQIIDSVGGVEIAVDCGIEDWRLREPDLDPADESNWEMFALPIGVHTMDGNLALWYVRSRRTSSDFDRGRRQQAMLRGLWRHVRTLGLMNQISEVWPQVVEIVETDIPLAEILTLIPVAVNLESSQMSSFTFQSGIDTVDWRSPEGSSVLLPIYENIESLMSSFVTAPTASQIRIDQPVVRILNASGDSDLAAVAADRLRWEGFTAFVDDDPVSSRQYTTIIDYSGQRKGGTRGLLQSVLHVSNESVEVSPDVNRQYDYEVVIGWSYYPCTYNVMPPG